jgi:hypothetical protein
LPTANGATAFAKELEVVKEERRLRTDDEPHARLNEVLEATSSWPTLTAAR